MDNIKQPTEVKLASYKPGSEGLIAPLKLWLEDEHISEIMLNKPQEIWVEKQGVIVKHIVPELTTAHLKRFFQLIANENKQTLSSSGPLLSGSIHDGSRIQLILPPTAKYPTFALRRQVKKDVVVNDYVNNNFYQNLVRFNIKKQEYDLFPETEKELITLYHKANTSQDWNRFICRAIQLRKNIVVSGGTSSGKTTFLNAYMQQIPENDRIILLEDTRELNIPHANQVSLVASKGDKGLAKVTMQELVQCCLRLRPDRIIMGEIRGAEIMDFVGACSTGHEGSLTTIHANNPRVAFMRMTQMYKQNNVPSMTDEDIMRELMEVVDVIIQINKTPAGRLASSIYYKYMNIKPECN